MSIADSTPSPVATLEAIRNYFNQLDADRVQFREWLSGEIDGGPNNDGYYPLTDLSGFEFLVPCPRLLESQIETEVVANIGGKMSKSYATWTALEAVPSNPLQLALVHGDTGTHTDPVTTAEVPNSGIYAGTPTDGEWAYIMPIPSGSAAFLDIDDDPEMAADSDELIPTQKAVKAHVAEAVVDAIKIKGLIDCSTNPMFPAANKGDTYVVSEPGLIGGEFGRFVGQGTLIIANQVTVGGNLATAGTDFFVLGMPLIAGTGVSITSNEAGNMATIAVDIAEIEAAIGTGYTDENARDAIGSALTAGSGISITVDDAGNQITIASTVAQYTDENAMDAIASMLTAGTNVTLTLDDASNTLIINADVPAGYSDEQVRDVMGATLLAGTGISLTVNDAGDTITIDSTGGSGGGSGGGGGGSYMAALVVRKTTDQTITTGAWRDVTWNVETYDNAGIFTAGGSDFTVPAGVNFMEVNVRVNWGNSTNSNRFIQLYNVTTAAVEAIEIRSAINEAGQTMNTGVIPVTAGHVYRIRANSGTITTTLSGTGYGGAGVLDVRFLASISDLLKTSGTGSATKWVLVDTNGVETSSPTWTYSGNVATVDVKGLTDYDDLLIVCDQVSADVSGSRAIQVSTDNGASFYSTSGNYVSINSSGVRTATTDIARHITFATAARDFVALIAGAGTSAPLKRALATDREERTFVASPLPINAIRFFNTTGGNLTGGSLYVFVRKRMVVSTGTAASPEEVWAGSSSDRVMTPNNTFAAAVTQTLVDGATITIDGNTGINFRVTLGGNRTLANPTNMKTGQSGIIIVTQDGTGGRTLSYGSNWRFAGGAATGGVLSTSANAVDVISYYVRSDGTIIATLSKDFKA